MFREPMEQNRILITEYLNKYQIERIMELEDDLSQIRGRQNLWSEAWWLIIKDREEKKNALLSDEQRFGIPPKYVRSIRCLREIRKSTGSSKDDVRNLTRLAKLDPVHQVHGLSHLLLYERASCMVLAAIIAHIGIRTFFNLDKRQ